MFSNGIVFATKDTVRNEMKFWGSRKILRILNVCQIEIKIYEFLEILNSRTGIFRNKIGMNLLKAS